MIALPALIAVDDMLDFPTGWFVIQTSVYKLFGKPTYESFIAIRFQFFYTRFDLDRFFTVAGQFRQLAGQSIEIPPFVRLDRELLR